MPFITKEKIKKPRILLLDFDDKIAEQLEEAGYNIFVGNSGYTKESYKIDVDPSEIELVFWDCSNLTEHVEINHPPSMRGTVLKSVQPHSLVKKYFDKVSLKGGVTTVFLGETPHSWVFVSKATGAKFIIKPRKTTTIFSENDGEFSNFIKQNILDDNIKFLIERRDSSYNVKRMLLDEDRNCHAFYDGSLFISPKVKDSKKAILMLLQDVYPHLLPAEIFPDLALYKWLNEDKYIFTPIGDAISQKKKIYDDYMSDTDSIDKKIFGLEKKYKFLHQALIADDSEIFSNEQKLTKQVKKMLEVIGFNVEDIDLKNKQKGKSLTEDLQIKEDDYLALVEVKGTEKGAKSNWIKKDFASNIRLYTTLNDLKPSELHTILVFNHERRVDPLERSEPYKDDPDLIEYCKQVNTTLVPIYQLYLFCIDVLFNGREKEEVKKLLKEPGLLIYS